MVVIPLPLPRPRRGVPPFCTTFLQAFKRFSLSSISSSRSSCVLRKEGAICAGEELGACVSLAASPLLFADSSLAGYSAVSALRANASVSSLPSVRPFRFPYAPYSRTMASADSRRFSAASRLRLRNDFAYFAGLPGYERRLALPQKLGSCTLARAYACGFLQIRSRNQHPCLWLTAGDRQPPFGTLTLKMTPMPGVLQDERPTPGKRRPLTM